VNDMFKNLELLWASEILDENVTIDDVPKMLRDNVRKLVEKSVGEKA